MENASKALIIAGSVLIALIIIGALILMFSNLTAYQRNNTQTTREAQIVEFNRDYETFDRDGVRGSELYSLLNKVIDYNRRKTTEGTAWADQGKDINYEAMEIKFSLDKVSNNLIADNSKGKLLIKNNNYTINKNNNSFENSIKNEIDRLEGAYGQESLTNLTTNLTAIFISDRSQETEKEKAVKSFNLASKKLDISSFDDIDEDSTIREDIYKYYEYIQFKRAYFNCTNVKYNSKTGRIISMEFEATGKLN